MTPNTKAHRTRFNKLSESAKTRTAKRFSVFLEQDLYTETQCWERAFDPLSVSGTLYRDLYKPQHDLFVLIRLATIEEVVAENALRDALIDLPLAFEKTLAIQKAYTVDRKRALGKLGDEILIRGSHELEEVR